MSYKETTLENLATTCENWPDDQADHVYNDFCDIVASYIKLSGDEQAQELLADEAECGYWTVARWAEGESKPKPSIQRAIVAWIAKRLRE